MDAYSLLLVLTNCDDLLEGRLVKISAIGSEDSEATQGDESAFGVIFGPMADRSVKVNTCSRGGGGHPSTVSPRCAGIAPLPAGDLAQGDLHHRLESLAGRGLRRLHSRPTRRCHQVDRLDRWGVEGGGYQPEGRPRIGFVNSARRRVEATSGTLPTTVGTSHRSS